MAVNSASVIPDSNGDFSTGLTHSWGVNTIETVAVDNDGNVSEDVRAVLYGDFLELGVPR
mgnify:CR=1 FL=1